LHNFNKNTFAMCNKKLFMPLLAVCLFVRAGAQQAYPVTDSTPLTINGLQMGFNILNEREKEVGHKGDFERYSVRFFATNTTSEAKIFMYRQGGGFLNDRSPDIVHFQCLNATGARFTSNAAFLQATPCSVPAQVEDKDCSTNKTVVNRRFVQIGYWIRPGETIHTDVIFIVPLGQYPKVTATPFLDEFMAGAR
jgi:hypothetical protein